MRIWDGRYRVERTLGEGGMGQVLLAHDLLQGERLVAVKLLLPDFREATPDFMREYSVQRRLDHPAIPAVSHFGFARHQGREVPYFAMDYVEGRSLHDAIAARTDPALAWPWILQILRGLDHVHRRGFLHRDLKPANIIVSSGGPPDDAAHIIDFGIAIPFGEPPEKLFLGTPEYSAPELMAGVPFDPRQDLYALGLLMYELVAHRRPWAGLQPTELYQRRMTASYPPLAHPACPPALARLVDDLLRPDPDERPATAAETIERFAEALGLTIPIETPTAFRRRLGAQPFPFGPRLDEAAAQWLGAPLEDGHAGPAILILEDPPGWDGRAVVHELTDRAAVSGARILRYALEPRPHGPLEAIEPALAELRRLREGRGPGALGGLAGAAMLLTRLPGPTVIAIAGLEWADTLSLEVLKTVFTGAKNPGLRLLATVGAAARPVAAHALGQLAALAQARTVSRDPLTRAVVGAWLDSRFGPGVVPERRLDALVATPGAGPDDVRAMLAEDYERGALVRTAAAGYRWSDGGAGDPPDRASSPRALGVERSEDFAALVATLVDPVTEAVAASFLGLPRAEIGLLVAEGHLVRVAGEEPGLTDVARARAPSAPSSQPSQPSPAEAALQATLQERLARAIEHATPFPGQAARAARAWLGSAEPLRALPHLLTAASERLAETPRRAREHLDAARATLERVARDNPGPRVRERLRDLHLEVGRMRLALARQEGDLATWREAAVDLYARGCEAEHAASTCLALDALVHLEADRGAWDAAEQHARALARLSDEASVSVLPWLAARVDRAEGRFEQALVRLDGIDVARTSPERHLQLLGLEAEIRVEVDDPTEADPALARYGELATSLGDARAEAHARLLRIARARRRQAPALALALARDLATDLGKGLRTDVDLGHHYRLDSRVARELAEGHVDLGLLEVARGHAARARELAVRDGDRDASLLAALLLARVDAALGERSSALDLLAEADGLSAGASRMVLWELELGRLELALTTRTPPEPARVAGAAQRLAAGAATEGLRGVVVRGLGLTARAATQAGLGALALAAADEAFACSSEWGGVGLPRHVLLFILARARFVRREGFRARRLLGKARTQLLMSAERLTDPALRTAFLAARCNAMIEAGDLTSPL